jgi:hypothetical protein
MTAWDSIVFGQVMAQNNPKQVAQVMFALTNDKMVLRIKHVALT